MKIKLQKHYNRKELWLEFGKVNSDGWHDMCWYAENGYKELPHFLHQRIKWLFKKNVYFKFKVDSTPPEVQEMKGGK